MRRRSPIAVNSSASAAVDSLQRGLEALRCFQPGEDVLEVAELSLRLDLPQTTTLRLLATLEAYDFVRRQPDTEQFGLSVGCLFVGQALLGSSMLVRKARPVLQNLADRFDVHVLLCVPERQDMLALFHASGKAAKPLPLGAGLVLPVASTALGCAWLWTQPPVVQGEWISRFRDATSGAGGSAQVAKIYQAFHDIEKGGVCLSLDGWRRGVAMAASSLTMRDGQAAAIGYMRSSTSTDLMIFDAECNRALRDAAEEISGALRRASA